MIEQDYLMRQILQLVEAMIAARQKKDEELNPAAAADSLESAITAATDLDGVALLSLSPESMAGVMQVSGIDPRLASYIAHSILLESVYLAQANNLSLASLREQQAVALAHAYDIELPSDPTDFEALERMAAEAQSSLYAGDRAGFENEVDQSASPRGNADDDGVSSGTPSFSKDLFQSADELRRLL